MAILFHCTTCTKSLKASDNDNKGSQKEAIQFVSHASANPRLGAQRICTEPLNAPFGAVSHARLRHDTALSGSGPTDGKAGILAPNIPGYLLPWRRGPLLSSSDRNDGGSQIPPACRRWPARERRHACEGKSDAQVVSSWAIRATKSSRVGSQRLAGRRGVSRRALSTVRRFPTASPRTGRAPFNASGSPVNRSERGSI